MSFKDNVKSKTKNCLNFVLNKTLNGLVHGFELFNESYELGEKYLFANKSKNFWQTGKLYRYYKGPVKINNLFWKENPYLYKDFSFEDYKIASKNKEELKFLYEKKLHKFKTLPNDKIFLVLNNCKFTFKLSMCRIMIDNEICILISTAEQSKYPWNYYEQVK
jgi:hypothetical protein